MKHNCQRVPKLYLSFSKIIKSCPICLIFKILVFVSLYFHKSGTGNLHAFSVAPSALEESSVGIKIIEVQPSE
jgi:hypothetical protein